MHGCLRARAGWVCGVLMLGMWPAMRAGAVPAPSTGPTSQPAQSAYYGNHCCFRYPAGWVPQKGATACFDVAAPPCPSHAFAELCLDVPHLPPHFAWMISAKRVEDGYVKNLRKTTLPNAHVDESTPVLVNGCQQARRVCCSGLTPAHQPLRDTAVIAVRDGAIYIWSCESNPNGDPLARAALDEAVATLQWTQ